MPAIISTEKAGVLGEIIRNHRRISKLSIKDLADLAGIGKTVVFDIEHGKETIQFSTLKKLLHALNISILLESPLMDHLSEYNDEKS